MSKAIFLAEYAGIPAGIHALDRIVKRSPVAILYARPVCVGKYLIAVGGEVDDVGESRALVESMPEKLLCTYLLTNAHDGIVGYFTGSAAPAGREGADLAVIEVKNASNGFHSLDRALKSGRVRLEHVWLGHFLGGKFCYILSGRLADVTAAAGAATDSIDAKYLVDRTIIPSPDPATLGHLIKGYEG